MRFDAESNGLSPLDLSDLRFVRLEVYPEMGEIRDGQDGVTGLDILAFLGLDVGDGSAAWCVDGEGVLVESLVLDLLDEDGIDPKESQPIACGVERLDRTLADNLAHGFGLLSGKGGLTELFECGEQVWGVHLREVIALVDSGTHEVRVQGLDASWEVCADVLDGGLVHADCPVESDSLRRDIPRDPGCLDTSGDGLSIREHEGVWITRVVVVHRDQVHEADRTLCVRIGQAHARVH